MELDELEKYTDAIACIRQTLQEGRKDSNVNIHLMVTNISRCENIIQELRQSQHDPVHNRALASLCCSLSANRNVLSRKIQQLSNSRQEKAATSKVGEEPEKDDCKEKEKRSRQLTIEETILQRSDIKLKDVVGLVEAKQALQEAIIMPLVFPHLFLGGRKPWKRILLYGPPGTGKSRLAQAIASEIQSTFYCVSSADLVSSWVGESEKLIKELFCHATKQAGRSVIFIDEIDSICRKRCSREDEYTRRIKTELLKQMEGADNSASSEKLFLMCATNCPWELDSAFLRRFQKRIYIPLPDRESRIQLMKLHSQTTPLDLGPQDWDKLADSTEGYSGSDLATLTLGALFQPIRDMQQAVHWRQLADGRFTPCSADQQGAFVVKLSDLPPDKDQPEPGKNTKGEDDRPHRAAFEDITNAVQKNAANGKKNGSKKPKQPVEMVSKAAEAKTKLAGGRAKATGALQGQRKKPAVVAPAANRKLKTCKEKRVAETELTSSQESTTSSQESAASADANISDISMADLEISHNELDHSRMSLDKSIHESTVSNQEEMLEVPLGLGVEDIDTDDQGDITLVALYAYDIFQYYKEREEQFMVKPYLNQQPQVTPRMRAVLVDWLVEVQENFELNHETLYLAVKLVDTYMAIVPNVPRDNIQLIGSVALFLASKFDERLPPAIDDFLYICDHAYQRSQFLAMERELFSTVGFDLGRPIAYRFLRRYARCARSEIKTLYLARFLLELSLMEYKFIFHRESMLAASCLYVARRMRGEGGWTSTLVFYTGYKLQELKDLILELNPLLTGKRNSDLATIRDKYKHYLFHSVGDIPPVSNEELFPQDTEGQ